MKNYWKKLQNKINNWRYAPVTHPSEIYKSSNVLNKRLGQYAKVTFYGID